MMKDIRMEGMEEVESTNPEAEAEDLPLMTEAEKRILDIYDRLEELQLEIALLKVQGVLSQDEPAEVSKEDIYIAQEELLKAKARYQIRVNVIENVLTANPILKAVHAGTNATIIEQDLLPLIQKRDALSISLTELTSKVTSARNELARVESECIATTQKNAELTTKMLSLAAEANSESKEDIVDPKLRLPLDELEAAVKLSRQRWRIMKGTASATIAGSGIDWARDPKLLDIVLDDDGEDG